MTNESKNNDNSKKLKNDGLDGYYHTGEVNLQTSQGNEILNGELDQYAFRGEYSMAKHYHGQPEYSVEEGWRDWDKGRYAVLHNSRISEEQKKLRKKVQDLLKDHIELDNLSISVFEGDIFISGRIQTNLEKSYFTELIKGIEGVKNVVNHLCCFDQDDIYQGPYRVLSQELGLGEEGR